MCSIQAEACLETLNPISSLPRLLLTANSIFASLYGPLHSEEEIIYMVSVS